MPAPKGNKYASKGETKVKASYFLREGLREYIKIEAKKRNISQGELIDRTFLKTALW